MKNENINKEKYSPEMQEFFDKATEALHLSGIEAARIAAQTGTPLVIYDAEKGIQEIMVTEKYIEELVVAEKHRQELVAAEKARSSKSSNSDKAVY